MKKTVLVFLNILLVKGALFGQSDIPRGINTLGGIFDTLYDRFGEKYTLSDLDIRSSKPLGGSTTVNAVPTQTCQAGYFTLYYAPGSIFTNSTAAQTVLCKVFSDVSTLINSACPAGAIKIYCTDTPPGSQAMGTALPFMSMPSGPISPNQGIIDNQVHKYLVSGQNPYATLPLIFNSNSFYYHGGMQMNPSAIWNFNMATTTIAANEYDAYSVMLHEVIHSLGFYSLITANGNSFWGSSNNYYSRYDQYLCDPAGNRLITSSTASTCPCNNLTFAVSPTVISTATTGCIADVTSPCSVAVQYSSSTVNTKVYTPNCFGSGSSLSHFEDMCPFTATVDLGCATNTSSTFNNNLYYVMSNAIGTGSCSVKRHPKEEERSVLCDLGYSVNSIYNSTVAGAGYTYSGGGCSGSNVWGINDGIVNGVYTFTALVIGAVNPSVSINIATDILINDSPNTSTISCLDLIAGSVTWTVTGGNLTFTANTGFSGPVIFRYMPKNNGSSSSITSFGGPTYIFAYIVPGNCPPSSCDIVSNGGFEAWNNVWPAYGCGSYNFPHYNMVNCWMPHTLSPDLFRRGCSGPGDLYTTAPGETHNLAPNDIIIGFQTSPFYEERIMNSLSSPLVPSQVYNLSLFAYQAAHSPTQAPFVLSIYSSPQYIAGSNYSLVANFTIMPINTWTSCSTTFTFNGGLNHNALIISGNYLGSIASGGSPIYYSCYIDDISIMPANSPTFVVPSANICGNSSFTNLAQYASPISGTFSGSLVTSYTNSLGTIYDFNASGTAPPGAYSIAFNYTASGCPKSIWQTIIVAPQQTLTVTGGTVNCFNAPTPVTISASLSCSSCTNSIYYSWIPGNLIGGSQTVTPNSTTIYTALAYNGTCTATQTLAINIAPPSFTLTANQSTLCIGNSVTLTASGSFTGGVWVPGSVANPAVVSPSASSEYSFIATSAAGCTSTQSYSLTVFTDCCHNVSYQTFTSTSVNSNTLTSPLRIQNSFTIQPTNTLSLLNSEFLFDPNVKITVSNGAVLNILGSHLYACSTASMWQGIVVQDGGKVYADREPITDTYGNLIEDAITAIDVTNHTTSSLSSIIFARRTIFNKNYIAINVSNYTHTLSPYPFYIDNCVFTCRDLPFTTTTWPQTGATSSLNTASADLRYVSPSTPTTGLGSPYLTQSGFTVTNLKNPYSNQKSYKAIVLNNVGLTNSSFYGIEIGGSGNASDFNLFDSHAYFIFAENSNVTCYNAVFQNTYLYGSGGAIYHSSPSLMNTSLNFPGTNTNLASRFWNCHSAIRGVNVYRFAIEHALFRSTQSSTLLPSPGFLPAGNYAINLKTNRFDYYMAYCEFSNINNPINVAIGAGSFTAGTTGTVTQNGVYANRIRVADNVFSNSSATNAYLNNALTIAGPNSLPWTVPPSSITPFTQGVIVSNNTLTNVFRGIAVSGSSGFQVSVEGNKIGLTNDNVFSLGQYGIQLLNAIPTSSTLIGKNMIASNTVSYTSSSYTTGAYGSLIFCGNNGYGVSSPSVTCNNVTQGYQGFVFDQTNKNAVWAGNTMQLPLARGMVLDHAGAIGTQGGTTTAIANQWTGGTWSSANGTYGTFTGTNSVAQQSPIYVKTGAYYPPANNGTVNNQFWYGLPSTTYTLNGGDYDCRGIGNNKIIPPKSEDFVSADQYYMDKTALYRFLHFNDSVSNSDALMQDFYDNIAGSSIDKFMQVEEKLYQGNATQAAILMNGIDDTDFNTVENNYRTYYNLYLEYINATFSSADSSNLYSLATLCPGTNGACVYQAIALYNLIYGETIIPGCEGSGARMMNAQGEKPVQDLKKVWNVGIYPNPATNQVTIVSKKETEILNVLIKDLSGRIFVSENVKINDFFVNLDLNLINGAYFIILRNETNETLTKKLLIAK